MPPKGSLKVSGSGLLEKTQSVDAASAANAPPVEGAANAPVVEEGPPVDEELVMLQNKAEAGKAELAKLNLLAGRCWMFLWRHRVKMCEKPRYWSSSKRMLLWLNHTNESGCFQLD